MERCAGERICSHGACFRCRIFRCFRSDPKGNLITDCSRVKGQAFKEDLCFVMLPSRTDCHRSFSFSGAIWKFARPEHFFQRVHKKGFYGKKHHLTVVEDDEDF